MIVNQIIYSKLSSVSEGFYDIKEGRHYQYIRNRQGSTMAVVNDVGEVVQRAGYYASGTPFVLPVDSSDGAVAPLDSVSDRLHIGNRWLDLAGLAMYDNTARVHDPIVPHMLTCDKYASKFPNFSPFSHCAGNPAMRIDPSGNDSFLFDSAGNVVDYEKNDEKDAIQVITPEGNMGPKLILGEGANLRLDKDCTDANNNYNNEKGNLHLQVMGKNANKVADKIYEFLSRNTLVEWGNIMTDKGKHYLSTSHNNNKNSGLSEKCAEIVNSKGTVPKNSHSHPGNTALPSEKDMGFINSLNEANRKNNPKAPESNSTIYLPGRHIYIKYNKDSEYIRSKK